MFTPGERQRHLGPGLLTSSWLGALSGDSEVTPHSYKPSLPPVPACLSVSPGRRGAFCALARPGPPQLFPHPLAGSMWSQLQGKFPSYGSSEGEQISIQLLSVHLRLKSCLVLNSENDRDELESNALVFTNTCPLTGTGFAHQHPTFHPLVIFDLVFDVNYITQITGCELCHRMAPPLWQKVKKNYRGS